MDRPCSHGISIPASAGGVGSTGGVDVQNDARCAVVRAIGRRSALTLLIPRDDIAAGQGAQPATMNARALELWC